MTHKKIGLKESLGTDENFMKFLLQEACPDTSKKSRKNAEKEIYAATVGYPRKKGHPTPQMLYDYVLGLLDKKDAMKIQKHFSFCGVCADEALRIMRIEDELNKKSEDRANWDGIPIRSSSISKSRGIKKSRYVELLKKVDLSPKLKHILDRHPEKLKEMIFILSQEPWEPQWAGVPATASEIPEQRHSFKIDEGEINLSCYWKPKFGNDPAYLHLSWAAKIDIPAVLRARFMNPETLETFSEICLSPRLQGEDNFTSDRLGFDPSNEKWAVSIIFEEIVR